MKIYDITLAMMMMILTMMIKGCGKTGEPAWVKDARNNCTPYGLALDRDSGGYIATNQILLCKDGTLRIIPQTGAVNGKQHIAN